MTTPTDGKTPDLSADEQHEVEKSQPPRAAVAVGEGVNEFKLVVKHRAGNQRMQFTGAQPQNRVEFRAPMKDVAVQMEFPLIHTLNASVR